MTRATVMGSGSWGTAFAMVLADAGTEVVLWGKDPQVIESVNQDHENPKYHPGIGLPPTLRATTDVHLALSDAVFVVLAVPAQVLRSNLAGWRRHLTDGARSGEPDEGHRARHLLRMSEVIARGRRHPRRPRRCGLGPNLAREIAHRQPSATVVACSDERARADAPARLHDSLLPRLHQQDVVGWSSVGRSRTSSRSPSASRSAWAWVTTLSRPLMTRGLAEIARLGAALGADQHTFAGLAGMGDLVATCSSPLSRNRTFGENLGRGMSLEEVDRGHQADRRGRQVLRRRPAARAAGTTWRCRSPKGIVAVMHGGLTPVELGRC